MYKKFGKRVFDIIASAIGLVLLSPLFIIISIWIKLSSKGPIFYKQKRVGQDFKEFNLYKFRSMISNADKIGPLVTSGDDPRITKVGKFIRRSKIDELPQLLNVLKGDMSLVGPRPEVMRYVQTQKEAYKKVLSVKPGITDNVAISFRDEEELMQQFEDKEKGYIEEILPKKIELYLEYIKNTSFINDLRVIFNTFFAADVLLPTNSKRKYLYLIADLIFTYISLYFAFLLRFDFDIPAQYNDDITKGYFTLILIRVIIFNFNDIFKVSWRYFGFRDHIKVVYSLLTSTVIFTIFIYLFRASIFNGFPRSVIPIEFFISLFLFLSFRASRRAFLEIFNKNALGEPVLIVANIDKAEEITRNLLAHTNRYFPVAILNNKDSGSKIQGVRVLNLESIKKNFNGIKVAIVDAKENLDDTYSNLKELNIQDIKLYKGFEEEKDGLVDISVEDLLARKAKDLDTKKIENFIKNKTILITGAGGSIGSELVRQCIKFSAKKLILLDHGEYNLYKIEQECEGKIDFECVMQSVVNKDLLEKTFTEYKPQIVLHAAAYKHVPLCEENIEEAILNNIIGTKNVIDLSIENNVEKFVLISTDKAVRPTNVMGATKRVCELYAQNVVSLENVESKDTEIVAVRFGNVLGSSGSVIPKFKEQIKNGGPITVTHPEITRYFMLIPEACALVLQAGAIGKGGEIFILDMGEPIKIVDLAKKMIELSGRDDIEIKFTGLRAGEKLYEELLIDEANAETIYKSILVAKPTIYNIDKLNQDIEKLLEKSDKISQLKKIVPEFEHKE